MTDQIFAYVPHSRQRQFEELGWEYANDLGPPHCAYASLYRWAGNGLPIYPKEDISVIKNDGINEDLTVSVNPEDGLEGLA